MDPISIVALIGVQIGLHYLGKYLAGTAPDTAAKFLTDQPVANQGAPIPMVFGRTRVRNPVLMWYGGFVHRTDLGTGRYTSPPLVTSVNYGLNMLFGVGIPMGGPTTGASVTSSLLGMYVGDLSLSLSLTHATAVRTGPLNWDFITSGLANPWSDPTGTGEQWGGLITFYGGASDQVLSDNQSSAVAGTDTTTITGSFLEFAYYADLTQIATFMRINADVTYRTALYAGGAGAPLVGADTLTPADVAVNIDPTTIPGYRNQMLVSLTGDYTWRTNYGDSSAFPVFEAFFIGNQTSLPPVSFEVRSLRVQYNSGWSSVDDCDPASAIYEILTNDLCGVGLDPSLIDPTTFGAASTTLLAEGNGYSRVVDTATDAKTLLTEIVAQISGALYQDSIDGLIKLKLIRNDYTIGSLPTFGIGDIIEVTNLVTGSWRNITNQVRVKFYERLFSYNEASQAAQNMASAVMQGTVTGDVSGAVGNLRSTTIEYPGCATRALAIQLAARDLNVLAQPLSVAQFTMTRAARSLRPGDAFVVSFPDYYLSSVVFRVTAINLGTLEDGKVVVDATQDPFQGGGALAFPVPT